MSSSSSASTATGTTPPSSAPLLAAPMKSTSEVHWERPLSAYISSAYGDDPTKYAREMAAMHKLRQDMRGAGSTADATGRDVLLKYYGQLELFELHFPVDEGTVEIPFEWFDAFTQEPTTQSSLAFEKACVIYNLASTLSRLAASSPRDIKRAYHHLQVAAGLFKFINDNFLHAPSRDLSRESIKFLADLMHAQAQEILLEKTLADKHGKVTKMAAKIAAGLAHLYAQVSAQCQPGTNLGMYMDSGERVIALVSAVKSKLYLAHAAMHRATLAEAEAQYGEVVARLAAAMADAKDAERWAKQLAGNSAVVAQAAASGTFAADGAVQLHEMAKAAVAIATDAHTRANKDNDVIYHTVVPAKDALPALDQLVVPGYLGFDQVLPGGAQELQQLVGNDVFAALIPMDVHEKASVYSEQKASVLRSATEMAEVVDAEVASALTGLGFPHALEKLTRAVQDGAAAGAAAAADELPANVQVMVAEMFGRDAHELYSTVAAMTGEAQSVVDQAQAKLDADQALEDRVKAGLGNPAAWTLPASSGLVARRDVAKARDAVRSAVAKDAAIFADYDRGVLNNPAVARVRPGRSLQSPSGGANGPSLLDVDNGETDLVADVRKLREKVSQLSTLKKERAAVVGELRTKMNADDISELLVLNAKQNVDEHIFRAELAKYAPLTEQLKANASTTRSVAKEVQVMWAGVQNHPRAKEAANAEAGRAKLVKDAEAAYTVFKDVVRKLTQAMETATELQDQCATVAKQVDVECLKRQREAEKVEQVAAAGKAQSQAEFLRQQLARMDIQPPASPVGPASPAHAPSPVAPPGTGQYGQYPPAANPYASAAAPSPPVNPYASTAAYASHVQPAAPNPPASAAYGGYPNTNYSPQPAQYQQQQQSGGYPTLSSSSATPPYHQPSPPAPYNHTPPPQQQQQQQQHSAPGSWPTAAGYQPQQSYPTTASGAYAAHPTPPPPPHHQQTYGGYAPPAQQQQQPPQVPGYYGAPPQHQQQQQYHQQQQPPAYGAYGQHPQYQQQPQQPQPPQPQYGGYGQPRPSGNLLD